MGISMRVAIQGATLLAVAVVGLAGLGCDKTANVTTSLVTAPQGEARVSLLYVYSSGDSWAHEGTTVATSTIDAALMTGGEGSVVTEETTTERRIVTVETATVSGEATLAVTTETVERIVDGVAQDVTDPPPQATTITVDSTGKVVAVAGSDDSAVTSGSFDSAGVSELFEYLDAGYDLTAVLYPEDGAAEVGEEWSSTYTIPLPGMGKELTLTATAKLVSVSTEDGRQVAVIEHSSRLPMDVAFDLSAYFQAMLEGSEYAGVLESVIVKMTAVGEITYAGTSKIDTATGRIISAEGDSAMSVKLTYTEAPEDLIPAGSRGPFAMDATGIVTIAEVD